MGGKKIQTRGGVEPMNHDDFEKETSHACQVRLKTLSFCFLPRPRGTKPTKQYAGFVRKSYQLSAIYSLLASGAFSQSICSRDDSGEPTAVQTILALANDLPFLPLLDVLHDKSFHAIH
jgi:hypothetical protein